MRNKEKEKYWLSKVKELCKDTNWKFKSYFIFKVIDKLYFSSNFFVNAKENSISVWVEYKTIGINNIFWDIIDEPKNKIMPLSFRGEAAFCVKGLSFFEQKVYVDKELRPENNINNLLPLIDKVVIEKANKIKTSDDFRTEMFSNEKANSVGKVTSFIEQGQYENAFLKIKEYKEQKISSGFGFGDRDFYDLANDYYE